MRTLFLVVVFAVLVYYISEMRYDKSPANHLEEQIQATKDPVDTFRIIFPRNVFIPKDTSRYKGKYVDINK